MKQAIGRGDVYLVDLNPTQGREIQTIRPCLVVSPDELNAHLQTFIVAPLTTGSHAYPFRIPCRVAGKSGHIVLDQLRTVDASRLIQRVGRIPAPTLRVVLERLREMFEP